MTKKRITTFLILAAVVFVLCGCVPQPFVEQVIATNVDSSDATVDKSNQNTRTLYVSGAVQNDGYITLPQVCDYKTVLDIAGATVYSVMPSNPTTLISANLDKLIIGFNVDGVDYFSVNVNDLFVTLRLSIDGVDDNVVNKLADYIEVNGRITNRDQLKLALDDDYADNYYKFYIDIADYA